MSAAVEGCVPLANRAGAPCGLCGSINDVCFKPPVAPPNFAKHDAMARRMEDEPYWAALARDSLAPFMPEIYACALLRNFDLLDAVVENLKAHVRSIEPRPHKDQEHAWASRAKGGEMRRWRREHMAKEAPRGRVNNTLEEPMLVMNFSEFKRAAPPSLLAECLMAGMEMKNKVDPIVVPAQSEEIVCSVCEGVVYPNTSGNFIACGAPTCPFSKGTAL